MDVTSALHTAQLEESGLSLLPGLNQRMSSWGMALGRGAGLYSEAHKDTPISTPQSFNVPTLIPQSAGHFEWDAKVRLASSSAMPHLSCAPCGTACLITVCLGFLTC